MNKISLLLVLLCSSMMIMAQKPVDLMLKSSASVDAASCFDILLRSPSRSEIKLAGQNYRLFYNADKMTFLEDRISHKLDPETYSKIDLISTIDNNIGFTSISIDGRDLTDNIVKLNQNGTWEKTLNICFANHSDEPFDITWANAKRTSIFATAEVAMSEWLDKNNQQILLPNEITDFSSLESLDKAKDPVSIDIYPNPFSEYVNINISNTSDIKRIMIKDVIGREVVNEQIDQHNNQLNYNLGDWPEGIYTVVLLDTDQKRISTTSVVKVVR